ncbi:hypothetical protein D3C81_2168600 [compost metagenome]
MREHIEDAAYWLIQSQHQIHDGQALVLEEPPRQIYVGIIWRQPEMPLESE